ncbi:MAG TPA: DUF559 domain-containing protein [Actinomycetota bacterium]|nr:DUF559 domain-containing protein [Actinomycetota bacterium]
MLVSGAAAAALWDLPGWPDGPLEVSHRGTKQSAFGIVVHRVSLSRADAAAVAPFPVTSPARTLADIAGRVQDASFDAAFHACLHRRLTDFGALRETFHRRARRGCAGAERMRRALDAYSPGDRPAASPLEASVARRLARSRLPAPRRQHAVWVAGRRRFLDFAWPENRVALEVDGYRWHSSRTAWESDRARLSHLRRAGWTVIQVTYDDVRHRFPAVIDEITAHL